MNNVIYGRFNKCKPVVKSEKTLEIVQENGLTTFEVCINPIGGVVNFRNLAKLIKLCMPFTGHVHVKKHEQRADCKSLMELGMLCITKDSRLYFEIEGDKQDAKNLALEIYKFINNIQAA